jgi:SAM-dependent methyltransferase
MAETKKSHKRRKKEGWFEKYAPPDKLGIDIGAGGDPIHPTFRVWDIKFKDGDATLMKGVPDNSYHTVYASHILEHLTKPILALKNWYRILKPGGHLIVVVPHRDLYEKKKRLPSRWNRSHKTFWLPDKGEPPDTKNFKKIIRKAGPGKIVLFRTLDEGFDYVKKNKHSRGEYSIEAIIQKKIFYEYI